MYFKEKAVEIAKIQNTIEGIVTTNTRIRQLVEEKTTPKNRDEQEIAGYRDVLNVIHESFDAIPITKNYISATHSDGHAEVLFTPPAPFETSEALDRISENYVRHSV